MSAETEIGRCEKNHGWTWSQDDLDFVPVAGLTIRWRFVGERRWRKHNVIPNPLRGQTQDSLLARVPEIVATLAQGEREPVSLSRPDTAGDE